MGTSKEKPEPDAVVSLGIETAINPTFDVSGLSSKSTVSPEELPDPSGLLCVEVTASAAGVDIAGVDVDLGADADAGSAVVDGVEVDSGAGVGVGSGVAIGVEFGTGVGVIVVSTVVAGVEVTSGASATLGVTMGVLGVTTLVGGEMTGLPGKTEGGTARVVGGAVMNVGGGGPMEVGVIVEKVDVSTVSTEDVSVVETLF